MEYRIVMHIQPHGEIDIATIKDKLETAINEMAEGTPHGGFCANAEVLVVYELRQVYEREAPPLDAPKKGKQAK